MFLLVIAALFLALYAARRAGRVDGLETRLRALEQELAILRNLLASRRSASGESPAEVAPLAPVESGAADELGEPELLPFGAATAVAVEETAVVEVAVVEEAPTRDAAPAWEAPGPPPRDAEPPPPPPPPPLALPQIDWERWLGVRGAAVLGGVFLALAGIFFFRYSIEHGLIPPWLRVIAGAVAGVGSIVAAERLLRRRYPGTADAVTGGGVVILYATAWASRVLYDLVGTPSAFVFMIAITAACSILSWRHTSLVIALLGLIGGFATPFMLASGVDNPIGLFAYVFLLDLGLLYLARERDWPLLALLSLAATLLYQFAWIILHMGPERSGTGLVILAVSSALFALTGRRARDDERLEWILTQAAGLLLPLVFVLYFAVRSELSPQLVPLALLVGLIGAAACWLGAVQRRPVLGLAAAAATVAILGVWMASHDLSPRTAWELAIVAVALASVFHVAVELQRDRAGADGPAPAALVAGLGLFWALVSGVGMNADLPVWPWLAAWIGLAAILSRHAAFPGRAWLQLATSIFLGLGLANAYPLTTPLLSWALWLALAVALQLVALVRADEGVRRWADHAAAAFATIALLNLPRAAESAAPFAPLALAVALGLGLLMALAAARLGLGLWYLAAVLVTAGVQWAWFAFAPFEAIENPARLFAIEAAGVALFSAFPFVVASRFRTDLWAWPAAALAGPAWFLSLMQLFLLAFGDGVVGVLPVGLGVLAAAQGWWARALWAVGDEARRRNIVWFFVSAIGFLTLAIPLQLEKEWITIAWALEGLGVILLWQRLDVVWLKYFALALLVSVTVRLVANPAVLGYYPRPSMRIVNWLAYTYLIPAAAMLGGARALRPLEVARVRAWEGWYARQRPLAAILLGFAGVVVTFVWINLAIADWFSTGPNLSVSLERMPARDLAMSISWALYALVLLAAGVRLRSVGVRWVSLGLMIVTIGKVFLYDLGELRDLYRVASLLGLAFSLIAVSLAYQRFVLVQAAEAEEP